MTITKDDREEIAVIERKFNNGSMMTHSEKCILVDWYELILIQKEQDVKSIQNEMTEYKSKLDKLR